MSSENCLWCGEEVDGDPFIRNNATWVDAWPFYSLPAGWMHRDCEEEARDQEDEERSLFGRDDEPADYDSADARAEQHEHDDECRYLGSGLWNCGTCDQS